MTLPGAITTGTFARDELAPALHAEGLVVADNLRAYDSAEARNALRPVGAKLWHVRRIACIRMCNHMRFFHP